MARNRFLGCVRTTAALVLLAAPVAAQTGSPSLGTVRITQSVTANGQPLAPGTYTIRLANDPIPPVVGIAADANKWVEFVQGGQVKGKEIATVVSGPDAKQVTKGEGPASGGSKVQLLKGSEYLRVWFNRAGTHYLIHLATQAR
jgi:hypothetical protein